MLLASTVIRSIPNVDDFKGGERWYGCWCGAEDYIVYTLEKYL